MNNTDNLTVLPGDVILEGEEQYSLEDLLQEDNLTYEIYDEYLTSKKKPEHYKRNKNSIPNHSKEDTKQIMNSKKAMDILPKKIIFNILQNCEIIQIINPSEFYIQRSVDCPCITNMLEIIDAKAKTAPTCISPEIGKIYIGKFTQDDNWYRAKVLEKQCDGKYFVSYIDYSNTEAIDLSRMKECPEELVNVPEFSVRCSLLDVMPTDSDTWSDEAIEAFTEMVKEGNSQVMMYSTEELEESYVCYVEIRKIFSAVHVSCDFPFSARKALSFMGYATFRGKPFIYEESSTELERTYKMPTVNMNTVISVKPGKVHTPWSFFLYAESDIKKYELETNSLQEYCNNLDIQTNVYYMIFYPIKGMLCIVFYGDKWYRAIVRKVLANGIVKVLNVDTGYEINVFYTKLRKLPDSFSRMPVQAMKSSLADIFPLGGKQEEEWSEEAIKFFINWLNDDSHMLKANVCGKKGELFEVDITVCTGNKYIDIAQLLVEKNYAITIQEKFAPEESGYLDLDPHEDKNYASMNKTSIFVSDRREVFIKELVKPVQKTADTKSSKRVEIEFLSAKSPDCIFVQFISQQVFSRELNKRLWQDWDMFTKADLSTVAVGAIFAVEYKKKNYARVKIIKMENNQCMTQLIDLGGLKAYCIDQLYALSGDLLKTKGFAAIVKLANIIPPCGMQSWPNTTVDYLKEILNEKETPFIVKCGSAFKDPNMYNLKVLPVKLGWIKVDYPGAFDPVVTTYPLVNQLLINSGLALPERCSSIPVMPEIHDGSVSELSVNIELPVVKSVSVATKFPPPDKPVKGWPAAEPLTDKSYEATVTNVDNLCNIYFHLVEHDRLLKQMELTYDYKLSGTQPTNKDLCWGITSPVVAQYHADDNWYRAIVNAVNEDSIHVCFVDYGNNDNISVTKIRATDDLYKKTPIVCYKGQLAEITPLTSKWQVKELDYIHHLIVEQRVNITLLEPYVENTTLKIKVEMVQTKQDLASFLVCIGNICRFVDKDKRINFNRRNDSIHASVSDGVAEEEAEEQEISFISSEAGRSIASNGTKQFSETKKDSPAAPEEAMALTHVDFIDAGLDLDEEQVFVEESLAEAPTLDFKLPKFKLPTNCQESFPVNLTKIVNTRLAFVVPYADYNIEETTFIQQLREIHIKFGTIMKNIKENKMQTNTEYSMQNLYLCEHNGEWERITIIGEYEDEIKVRYIDFGEEKFVHKTEIRTLPPEAYNIPPMAMPIYIIDSESQALRSLFYKNTPDAIMKKIKDMNKTVFASVIESRRIPKMKLFILHQGVKRNLFEYITN